MNWKRLAGVLLCLLWIAGMIVGRYGYRDVEMPLGVAVPTIFVLIFLCFYFISIVVMSSFTYLPTVIKGFFTKGVK